MFIWGQFLVRYHSHQSLKLAWKLSFVRFYWNLPGVNELRKHWQYISWNISPVIELSWEQEYRNIYCLWLISNTRLQKNVYISRVENFEKDQLTHLSLEAILKLEFIIVYQNSSMGTCYKLALSWMPQLTIERSTLVQIMAWCHVATCHYLWQYWPRSTSPFGVTQPQRVNVSQTCIHSYVILASTHYGLVIQCDFIEHDHHWFR